MVSSMHLSSFLFGAVGLASFDYFPKNKSIEKNWKVVDDATPKQQRAHKTHTPYFTLPGRKLNERPPKHCSFYISRNGERSKTREKSWESQSVRLMSLMQFSLHLVQQGAYYYCTMPWSVCLQQSRIKAEDTHFPFVGRYCPSREKSVRKTPNASFLFSSFSIPQMHTHFICHFLLLVCRVCASVLQEIMCIVSTCPVFF